MLDLNKPQRQSVVGVVVIFFKNLRKALNIIFSFIFVQFSIIKSDITFLWISMAVIIGIVIVFSILIYRKFLFYIEDDQFVIDKGLFKKEKISVPFERIQSVHIDQNIIQRILQVVGLKIDTAGSVTKEMEIAALPKAYARSIQEFLIEKKNLETSESELESPVGGFEEKKVKEPSKLLVELSLLDVLKVGITENHLKTSAALFALINGYFWQSQDFFLDFFQAYIEEGQELWFNKWLILLPIIVVVLLLISIILSTVLSVLKYYGLRFIANSKEVQKLSGLLKRTEYQIPISKIQFLKYSTNPLRKLFGISTVVVKQASSKAASDKQSLMIPGCNKTQLETIIKEFFPELNQGSLVEYKASAIFRIQMVLLFALVPSIIIGIIGFLDIRFLLLSLFWLLLALPISFKYAAHMSLEINSEVIRFRKGWLFPKTELLKYYKLQSVTLRQNVFQKRRNLAHLDFYTAAGSLRMWQLDATVATELYNYILYKIEESEESWM